MMAPGDVNGCGSCGLSGEMEASSTWRGLQLRFGKGALRVRGPRMEEVRAKEMERGALLRKNAGGKGQEAWGLQT